MALPPKNRSHVPATAGQNRKSPRQPGRRMASRNAGERAAFFARREAATVLRRVLRGDASRRAGASIKSLVYSPSVRNKRATFALVCQTLKYLPILKEILASSGVLTSKWKRQEELVYVTSYDILFGQETTVSGAVEQLIMLHKDTIMTALEKICVRRKVSSVEDLLSKKTTVKPKPRFLRVNTLKTTTESVIEELSKIYMVDRDDMVPDMLALPPGTDLHNHPLVMDGKVFLQGKASCMVAVALCPKPGWKVIDACAAPGNKTIHLAALMNGEGSIIACELNKERAKTLQHTIRRSGGKKVRSISAATKICRELFLRALLRNGRPYQQFFVKYVHEPFCHGGHSGMFDDLWFTDIKTVNGDFLDIDSNDPSYAEVRAILLDPSCSGSGICTERLDYLLPSYSRDDQDDEGTKSRIRKLSAFQRKALSHALSFPSLERLVYSTCSIHQAENEDVISSVLPLASSLGFELASPFPQWRRRGFPVFDGADHLLRTDPEDDLEGFFIALFVRKTAADALERGKDGAFQMRRKQVCRRWNRLRVLSSLRLSRMVLW